MKLDICLDKLSDDALIARVHDLLSRGRRVDAELVAHLAEVDARRLYRREACPSMHAYATERLHLSEAEAYFRITVARVSRRFPMVLDMLADGRLHLSGIAKLAPHLRDDCAEELLGRAAFKSKRDIERLVAALAPQPDAPDCIRKLPDRRGSAATGAASVPAPLPAPLLGPGRAGRCDPVDPPAPALAPPAPPPPSAAAVKPIAPRRYKVQFTAGEPLHDKIVRAQALLRREIPDGDLAAVMERAMTLLLEKLERRKFAATPRPRQHASEVDPTPRSRHVPAAIRRAVWERDGGQCTYRDQQGRRCPARERLEFDHAWPFGQGGDHSAANVRLRCTCHNTYQAELDYGPDFIARCRDSSVPRVEPGVQASAAGPVPS